MTLTTTFAAASNVFDVKQYGGARGDCRKVSDAVITNGAASLTSATAAFTAADVGKLVQIYDNAGNSLRTGSIAAYVSATQVTLNSNSGSTTSGCILVWYTQDDTAAIVATVAAAKALAIPGKVVVPPGGYFVSAIPFDLSQTLDGPGVSVQGAGQYSTTFYLSSAFDVATPPSGCVIQTLHAYCNLEGFGIDGLFHSFSASGKEVIYAYGNTIMRNIRVMNCKGFTAALQNDGNLTLYSCHFEQASFRGISNAGNLYAYDTYTGNHGSNGFYQANNSLVKWFGGICDECSNDAVAIAGGLEHEFVGAFLFGPGSKFAINVSVGARATLTNCSIIAWSSGNRGGLTNAGTMVLTNCRMAGSGSGDAINNTGTIYDGGGNILGGLTGDGNTGTATVTGTPIGCQSITAAGAIDTSVDHVRITGPSSSTYAVTLAAPPKNRRRMLTIEMIATTSTNSVTLALTNVDGGSAATTATFTVAGHKLVLAPGETKWTVVKELGVAMS